MKPMYTRVVIRAGLNFRMTLNKTRLKFCISSPNMAGVNTVQLRNVVETILNSQTKINEIIWFSASPFLLFNTN